MIPNDSIMQYDPSDFNYEYSMFFLRILKIDSWKSVRETELQYSMLVFRMLHEKSSLARREIWLLIGELWS